MFSYGNVICVIGSRRQLWRRKLLLGRHVHPIHPRTVRGRLKERGILYHCPVIGQILARRHRVNRLQWARNKFANRRNWRDVVFSDESQFNLSSADGRKCVYRRRHERYAENCVLQCHRFGGSGVMVHQSQLPVIFDRSEEYSDCPKLYRPDFGTWTCSAVTTSSECEQSVDVSTG